MKKFISLLVVVTLLLTAFIPQSSVSAAYNYSEALQKAIFFYECQQAGPLMAGNRVSWRGNATMNDGVLGGWYDAGDHVKFNLPMAYTASMLGWALYEYKSGFDAAGQTTYMKNNLKFVLDYLVACDKGSSVVYQVGAGSTDHSWWGPVEVIEKRMTRPTYTCTASCVAGQMAAALAIGSIVLGDSSYLTHAKSLFNLADSTKSDATYTEANGFYNSWSGFYDELVWSGVWLYLATNDSTYLTKAESYVPNLNKQQQTTYYEYKWAQSWDDSHYGALLLLARITGKQEYHDFVKMHLDWWTVGFNGEKVKYTPGGLAWLDTWGSLRYACNAAFIAQVYSDMITDATLKARYANFAKSQIDYCLGSNPGNRSYEIGFGTNPPQHPHHRTAHSSWLDSQTTPAYHRHILYGALVGGPDSSDAYTDEISNYTTNEVACDYNAGFVGMLAKMAAQYGGTALANFPVKETPENEFFMEAKLSSQTNSSDIQIFANNHSGWPARTVKNLSFNYYMDLSEVSPSSLTVSTNYLEFPVTISPVTQYSGNIYYVKITFTDGTNIYPGGQSPHAAEVQLRVTSSGAWDPSNDPSNKGLTGTVATTQYITMYDGSTLIWGTEPGGATPTPSTATNTPTPTPSTATPTATPSTATPTPTPSTATPTPTPSTATPTPTPSTATPTATPSTATPTPTPSTATATPTPTAGTPVPGGIKVQFFNGNTAASTNTLYPNFKLVNTGTAAITLSNVKMRYFFTNDGTQANSFACDYSTIGSGNVTSSFTTIAKTNADRYCEVGFSSAAGSLAAGASVEVKARIWKSDWSNFTQTNDYSFNATATNYVDSTTVTGYVSGALSWGVEP